MPMQLSHTLDRAAIERAIRAFTSLLAKNDAHEADFQRWFESHPVVLACLGFAEVISHPALVTDAGETYIPDFMVQDLQGLWHILELKTPSAKVLKSAKRRQDFHATLNSHIRQCCEYAAYFDDRSHRDRFEQRHGYKIEKSPPFMLVCGRSEQLDRPLVHEIMTARAGGQHLFTYDDIASRLEFFRAQQWSRYEQLPGWALLAAVRFPNEAVRNTFVLDVGAHKDRDRISVYVDHHDRICFRVRDARQDEEVLRADFATVTKNTWTYLLLEVGSSQDYSFINMEIGGALAGFRRIHRLNLGVSPFLVVGSDVCGHSPSNFEMGVLLIYGSTLAFAAKGRLHDWLTEQYGAARPYLQYSGHTYMRSAGHPNFPRTEELNWSQLVQPIEVHRPLHVPPDGSGIDDSQADDRRDARSACV